MDNISAVSSSADLPLSSWMKDTTHFLEVEAATDARLDSVWTNKDCGVISIFFFEDGIDWKKDESVFIQVYWESILFCFHEWFVLNRG